MASVFVYLRELSVGHAFRHLRSSLVVYRVKEPTLSLQQLKVAAMAWVQSLPTELAHAMGED